MSIELFFRLLGSVALLIYGMKTMSDALQKLAGPSLRHILARMTGNRLMGMLTGTMVTCAVQSSSATTVMTVSFVSAGLLKYSYSLGTLYNDIVADCEKIGDFVMNIVEARLGRRLVNYKGLQLNLDKKTVTIEGDSVNLTPTEFALLHLLLVNRGKVLSRQQLMDTIWAGVIVTEHTVNVNITRLRKKLGSYAQNIVSRTGFGYVFEE